ncbi:hypothetical protein QTP88_006022 [Uroleucon formosanum]
MLLTIVYFRVHSFNNLPTQVIMTIIIFFITFSFISSFQNILVLLSYLFHDHIKILYNTIICQREIITSLGHLTPIQPPQ